MSDVMMKSPALLQNQLETRRIATRVKVTGAAAATGKILDVSGLPGHLAVAASGFPVTAIDASATGITVSDTAPATIGVLLYDLAANDVMDSLLTARVEVIQAAGATGAAVVTRRGTLGLTAEGNVWLEVSLPGATLTSPSNVLELGLDIAYKVRL